MQKLYLCVVGGLLTGLGTIALAVSIVEKHPCTLSVQAIDQIRQGTCTAGVGCPVVNEPSNPAITELAASAGADVVEVIDLSLVYEGTSSEEPPLAVVGVEEEAENSGREPCEPCEPCEDAEDDEPKHCPHNGCPYTGGCPARCHPTPDPETPAVEPETASEEAEQVTVMPSVQVDATTPGCCCCIMSRLSDVAWYALKSFVGWCYGPSKCQHCPAGTTPLGVEAPCEVDPEVPTTQPGICPKCPEKHCPYSGGCKPCKPCEPYYEEEQEPMVEMKKTTCPDGKNAAHVDTMECRPTDLPHSKRKKPRY